MLKRKVLFTVLVVAVVAAAILVYAAAERRLELQKQSSAFTKRLSRAERRSRTRLLPRTWATRCPRGFLCAHIVRVRKVVYH